MRPDRPVRTDHVDLVQPLDPPRDRWITQVRITVNHDQPFVADLGDASFTSGGERIRFPRTTVRSLRIEIAATHDPTFDPQLANAVGFAEIRLGHVRVHETVRLPVDLDHRIGSDAAGHSLAVVMTRLRQETATGGRHDEELALDRRFVLSDARTFTLGGTVRIDPDAPDHAIDSALGTAVPGAEFSASSHLLGDVDAACVERLHGVRGHHVDQRVRAPGRSVDPGRRERTGHHRPPHAGRPRRRPSFDTAPDQPPGRRPPGRADGRHAPGRRDGSGGPHRRPRRAHLPDHDRADVPRRGGPRRRPGSITRPGLGHDATRGAEPDRGAGDRLRARQRNGRDGVPQRSAAHRRPRPCGADHGLAGRRPHRPEPGAL